MHWLLIITLSIPGQPSETLAVGLIAGRGICAIAGAGMAAVFEASTPGLTASWACVEGETA